MSLRRIRDILIEYFWLMCFHLAAGRHVWIQFWFILANFYIIFNLPPHTFPLCFYFVVCSIWLLSLSSNHILREAGPNILFIYSLASILFQFCFKHINPSFTISLFNKFEFSHIPSQLAATASHFSHYLPVDQLYAKEVYFCSFLIKCNLSSIH